MAANTIRPTGHERTFEEDEIIVSKTDLKGIITYANSVFQRVAGYTEEELLGQPHNIVRHPDMPAYVFKLLWETIQSGKEIFAYVLNLAKNGDHYWVFAHVTPTFGPGGRIIGYHSNRRVPEHEPLERIKGIYHALIEEERRHLNRQLGMQASGKLLDRVLQQHQMEYEELVFAL